MSKDDKLITIETLVGQFDKVADLQAYCDVQYRSINQLTLEKDALVKEIGHLKDLLASTTILLHDSQEDKLSEVSSEEAICQIQIEKLREKAFTRELTLEETKRLEILVKSLHLIRTKGTSAVPVDYTMIPSGSSVEQLAQLAAGPEPQSDSD